MNDDGLDLLFLFMLVGLIAGAVIGVLWFPNDVILLMFGCSFLTGLIADTLLRIGEKIGRDRGGVKSRKW